MVLVIQVPAKYSYFVIRVKLLRLRILRENYDNFDALNNFIDLYYIYQDVVFISSKNINI